MVELEYLSNMELVNHLISEVKDVFIYRIENNRMKKLRDEIIRRLNEPWRVPSCDET